METITAMLALITGLLLRLAIPIILTILLVFILRKLDARWQADARFTSTQVQRMECWKIKGCPPEQQKNCIAATSHMPCWQVYRLPNGYLHEECLSCRVFIDAPLPTLQIQPRRM
jgi:hypothetical protein